MARSQRRPTIERPSRCEGSTTGPPAVSVSPFAEMSHNEEQLYTPFGDVPGVEDNEVSSNVSSAESHRGSRGWIAECLWWLASCRRRRYESDYVVLFVDGRNRFGSNHCYLSVSWDAIFLFARLDTLVMSDGSPTGLRLSEGYLTDDSPYGSDRAMCSRWLREAPLLLKEALCCAARRGHTGTDNANAFEERFTDGGTQTHGTNVVPLSDPRLKPRLPKLLILFLVLVSLGGILCVFFFVPRGVSVGDPEINVQRFTVDSSEQSFHLIVNVILPFKNPNYVSVDIIGTLRMTYYDARVDSRELNIGIPKQHTTKANVTLDSTGLRLKYISVLIQHCYAFPWTEVFFISGEFQAKYLLQTHNMSIDTYKFIDCPIGAGTGNRTVSVVV